MRFFFERYLAVKAQLATVVPANKVQQIGENRLYHRHFHAFVRGFASGKLNTPTERILVGRQLVF